MNWELFSGDPDPLFAGTHSGSRPVCSLCGTNLSGRLEKMLL